MKSHGVSDEILGTRLKSKLFVNLLHRVLIKVKSLMSGRILILPVLEELEKGLGAAFLPEAHEGGLYGLHLGRGDLADPAVSVDERAGDLFEFEVAGDVCVDEHFRELAGGDDELWDEVDGVVSIPA